MNLCILAEDNSLANRVADYIANRFKSLKFTVCQYNLQYPVIKFCEVMNIQDPKPILENCYKQNKKIFTDYLIQKINNIFDDFIIVSGVQHYEEAEELKNYNFNFIKIGKTPYWPAIPELFFINSDTKNPKYIYNDTEIIVYRLADDYL